MNALDMLDAFIGLITVYLILSLIVTATVEYLGQIFGLRGKTVKLAIDQLVGEWRSEKFFAHPRIKNLQQDDERYPSAIPNEIFSEVMIDMVVGAAYGEQRGEATAPVVCSAINPAQLEKSIVYLENTHKQHQELLQQIETAWKANGAADPQFQNHILQLRSALHIATDPKSKRGLQTEKVEESLTAMRHALADDQNILMQIKKIWGEAGYDVAAFRKGLEGWYQATTDRSRGWFKRKLIPLIFGTGLVVSIAVNADTIRIFSTLMQNDSLRQSYVDAAIERVKVDFNTSSVKCSELKSKGSDLPAECDPMDYLKTQIPEVISVVGWEDTTPLVRAFPAMKELAWNKIPWGTLLLSIIGWLMTAIALSLGGSFWYNLLKKLVLIRTSVRSVTQGGDEEENEEKPAGTAQVSRGLIRTALTGAEQMQEFKKFASFDDKCFGYSLTNALWCARMSNLVYSDKAVVEAQVQEWGASVTFGEYTDRYLKDGAEIIIDTQYAIAYDDRVAILAFRGTEKDRLDDFATDAKYQQVRAPWREDESDEGIRLHSGFAAALHGTGGAAWTQIGDALAAATKKGQSLWITGHSLGGALALLAAYRVLEPGSGDSVKFDGLSIGGVYTFGQPRVGNGKFAERMDVLLPSRHFQVVNNRDIVPLIPLKSMDYKHSGRIIYFNELGQALIDPPVWYRGLDKLTLDFGKLKEKGFETVKDHSMAGYVAAMRQTLGMGTPDTVTI